MENIFEGIEHIGIKALDIEKSIKFYTEILGFKLLNRIKPGEVELAFLQLDQDIVELVEVNDHVVYNDGVVNHLAFRVQDIFAAVELLRANNVKFITPEPSEIGEGKYNFFFRGPSEEKLELFQG